MHPRGVSRARIFFFCRRGGRRGGSRLRFFEIVCESVVVLRAVRVLE